MNEKVDQFTEYHHVKSEEEAQAEATPIPLMMNNDQLSITYGGGMPNMMSGGANGNFGNPGF